MPWTVLYTERFETWFMGLDGEGTVRVEAAIDYLGEHGPGARRPIVGEIEGARYKNLKELRVGSLRVLFAFDPERRAVLLVGGDKSQAGWKRWYEDAIQEAVRLFDEHLRRMAVTSSDRE